MTMGFSQQDGFDGPAFVKPKTGTLRTDAEIAEWAWQTVREMRTDDDLSNRESELACFLVASSLIGPDENRICRALRLHPGLCALWARNLRRANLWTADGIAIDEHWFDEDLGYLHFSLTVSAAMGLVEFGGIQKVPCFTVKWRLTEFGKRTAAVFDKLPIRFTAQDLLKAYVEASVDEDKLPGTTLENYIRELEESEAEGNSLLETLEEFGWITQDASGNCTRGNKGNNHFGIRRQL